MPIYDYRCTDSGAVYEVFHKNRELSEDIICPSCKSMSARKLMSVPSIAIGKAAHDSCASGACESPAGGCCGGGMCDLN